MEGFAKEFFSTSAMLTCAHKEIPEISGEKMKFHFEEGATIKNAYTPAQVAYYYKEETKALLGQGCSRDGGPPFNSEAFREFCRKWRI